MAEDSGGYDDLERERMIIRLENGERFTRHYVVGDKVHSQEITLFYSPESYAHFAAMRGRQSSFPTEGKGGGLYWCNDPDALIMDSEFMIPLDALAHVYGGKYKIIRTVLAFPDGCQLTDDDVCLCLIGKDGTVLNLAAESQEQADRWMATVQVLLLRMGQTVTKTEVETQHPLQQLMQGIKVTGFFYDTLTRNVVADDILLWYRPPAGKFPTPNADMLRANVGARRKHDENRAAGLESLVQFINETNQQHDETARERKLRETDGSEKPSGEQRPSGKLDIGSLHWEPVSGAGAKGSKLAFTPNTFLQLNKIRHILRGAIHPIFKGKVLRPGVRRSRRSASEEPALSSHCVSICTTLQEARHMPIRGDDRHSDASSSDNPYLSVGRSPEKSPLYGTTPLSNGTDLHIECASELDRTTVSVALEDLLCVYGRVTQRTHVASDNQKKSDPRTPGVSTGGDRQHGGIREDGKNHHDSPEILVFQAYQFRHMPDRAQMHDGATQSPSFGPESPPTHTHTSTLMYRRGTGGVSPDYALRLPLLYRKSKTATGNKATATTVTGSTTGPAGSATTTTTTTTAPARQMPQQEESKTDPDDSTGTKDRMLSRNSTGQGTAFELLTVGSLGSSAMCDEHSISGFGSRILSGVEDAGISQFMRSPYLTVINSRTYENSQRAVSISRTRPSYLISPSRRSKRKFRVAKRNHRSSAGSDGMPVGEQSSGDEVYPESVRGSVASRERTGLDSPRDPASSGEEGGLARSRRAVTRQRSSTISEFSPRRKVLQGLDAPCTALDLAGSGPTTKALSGTSSSPRVRRSSTLDAAVLRKQGVVPKGDDDSGSTPPGTTEMADHTEPSSPAGEYCQCQESHGPLRLVRSNSEDPGGVSTGGSRGDEDENSSPKQAFHFNPSVSLVEKALLNYNDEDDDQDYIDEDLTYSRNQATRRRRGGNESLSRGGTQVSPVSSNFRRRIGSPTSPQSVQGRRRATSLTTRTLATTPDGRSAGRIAATRRAVDAAAAGGRLDESPPQSPDAELSEPGSMTSRNRVRSGQQRLGGRGSRLSVGRKRGEDSPVSVSASQPVDGLQGEVETVLGSSRYLPFSSAGNKDWDAPQGSRDPQNDSGDAGDLGRRATPRGPGGARRRATDGLVSSFPLACSRCHRPRRRVLPAAAVASSMTRALSGNESDGSNPPPQRPTTRRAVSFQNITHKQDVRSITHKQDSRALGTSAAQVSDETPATHQPSSQSESNNWAESLRQAFSTTLSSNVQASEEASAQRDAPHRVETPGMVGRMIAARPSLPAPPKDVSAAIRMYLNHAAHQNRGQTVLSGCALCADPNTPRSAGAGSLGSSGTGGTGGLVWGEGAPWQPAQVRVMAVAALFLMKPLQCDRLVRWTADSQQPEILIPTQPSQSLPSDTAVLFEVKRQRTRILGMLRWVQGPGVLKSGSQSRPGAGSSAGSSLAHTVCVDCIEAVECLSSQQAQQHHGQRIDGSNGGKQSFCLITCAQSCQHSNDASGDSGEEKHAINDEAPQSSPQKSTSTGKQRLLMRCPLSVVRLQLWANQLLNMVTLRPAAAQAAKYTPAPTPFRDVSVSPGKPLRMLTGTAPPANSSAPSVSPGALATDSAAPGAAASSGRGSSVFADDQASSSLHTDGPSSAPGKQFVGYLAASSPHAGDSLAAAGRGTSSDSLLFSPPRNSNQRSLTSPTTTQSGPIPLPGQQQRTHSSGANGGVGDQKESSTRTMTRPVVEPVKLVPDSLLKQPEGSFRDVMAAISFDIHAREGYQSMLSGAYIPSVVCRTYLVYYQGAKPQLGCTPGPLSLIDGSPLVVRPWLPTTTDPSYLSLSGYDTMLACSQWQSLAGAEQKDSESDDTLKQGTRSSGTADGSERDLSQTPSLSTDFRPLLASCRPAFVHWRVLPDTQDMSTDSKHDQSPDNASPDGEPGGERSVNESQHAHRLGEDAGPLGLTGLRDPRRTECGNGPVHSSQDQGPGGANTDESRAVGCLSVGFDQPCELQSAQGQDNQTTNTTATTTTTTTTSTTTTTTTTTALFPVDGVDRFTVSTTVRLAVPTHSRTTHFQPANPRETTSAQFHQQYLKMLVASAAGFVRGQSVAALGKFRRAQDPARTTRQLSSALFPSNTTTASSSGSGNQLQGPTSSSGNAGVDADMGRRVSDAIMQVNWQDLSVGLHRFAGIVDPASVAASGDKPATGGSESKIDAAMSGMASCAFDSLVLRARSPPSDPRVASGEDEAHDDVKSRNSGTSVLCGESLRLPADTEQSKDLTRTRHSVGKLLGWLLGMLYLWGRQGKSAVLRGQSTAPRYRGAHFLCPRHASSAAATVQPADTDKHDSSGGDSGDLSDRPLSCAECRGVRFKGPPVLCDLWDVTFHQEFEVHRAVNVSCLKPRMDLLGYTHAVVMNGAGSSYRMTGSELHAGGQDRLSCQHCPAEEQKQKTSKRKKKKKKGKKRAKSDPEVPPSSPCTSWSACCDKQLQLVCQADVRGELGFATAPLTPPRSPQQTPVDDGTSGEQSSEQPLLSCISACNRYDINAALICAGDWIGEALSALCAYPNIPSAQQEICSKLRHIAASNFALIPSLVQQQAVDIIVMSVLRSDDAMLYREAAGVVWAFSVSSLMEAQVTVRGALIVLVNALRAYPDFSSVQQQVCGALRNLSVSMPNKKRLRRLGLVGLLLRVLRAHRRYPQNIIQGVGLVHNLAYLVPCAVEMIEKGVLNTIGSIVVRCLSRLGKQASVSGPSDNTNNNARNCTDGRDPQKEEKSGVRDPQIYIDLLSECLAAAVVLIKSLKTYRFWIFRKIKSRRIAGSKPPSQPGPRSLLETTPHGDIVASLGTLRVVAQCMLALPGREHLQFCGCQCFRHCLEWNGTGPQVTKELAVSNRGSQLLVAAVRHFPQFPDLHREALMCLVHLVRVPECAHYLAGSQHRIMLFVRSVIQYPQVAAIFERGVTLLQLLLDYRLTALKNLQKEVKDRGDRKDRSSTPASDGITATTTSTTTSTNNSSLTMQFGVQEFGARASQALVEALRDEGLVTVICNMTGLHMQSFNSSKDISPLPQVPKAVVVALEFLTTLAVLASRVHDRLNETAASSPRDTTLPTSDPTDGTLTTSSTTTATSRTMFSQETIAAVQRTSLLVATSVVAEYTGDQSDHSAAAQRVLQAQRHLRKTALMCQLRWVKLSKLN